MTIDISMHEGEFRRAIAAAQTTVDIKDPEWGMRFVEALAVSGWNLIPLAMIDELKNTIEELSMAKDDYMHLAERTRV